MHYQAHHRESFRKLALFEFPVRPSDDSPLFLETRDTHTHSAQQTSTQLTHTDTQTSCGTTNKPKTHISFLLVFFCSLSAPGPQLSNNKLSYSAQILNFKIIFVVILCADIDMKLVKQPVKILIAKQSTVLQVQAAKTNISIYNYGPQILP